MRRLGCPRSSPPSGSCSTTLGAFWPSWRLPRCTEGEAMTDLLLQPSGANEYEVIDGDWIVGHIVLLSSAMARTLWMWSLDHAFHKGHDPSTALRPRGRLPCRRSREAGSVRTNRLWGNQMVLAAFSGRRPSRPIQKPAREDAKAPAMQHLLGAFLCVPQSATFSLRYLGACAGLSALARSRTSSGDRPVISLRKPRLLRFSKHP